MRLFSTLGLLILGTVASGNHWGYEESNGPVTWSHSYPECGGKLQSPINIDSVIETKQDTPIWGNYDQPPKTMRATNNGHSLSLSGDAIGNTTTPPMLILGYDKVLALDSVHFHWGKNNSVGSEHTLGGSRYPLEMHAVHKRIDINGAVATPLDIVVVSQLYQISDVPNEVLQNVLLTAPNVKVPGASISIKPFEWSRLIKPFTEKFYKYRGSLTTPPCSEAVTFYIRDKIFKVSKRQMELLRTLQNEEEEELSGNFRSIQPTNGRPVYYVVNISDLPNEVLQKVLPTAPNAKLSGASISIKPFTEKFHKYRGSRLLLAPRQSPSIYEIKSSKSRRVRWSFRGLFRMKKRKKFREISDPYSQLMVHLFIILSM